MKKTSKWLISIFFMLAVLCSTFVPAFAAGEPAQVKGLKVSAVAYNSVTLTWTKVSNANKGYQIEQYNTSTKKWAKVASTSKAATVKATVGKLTTGTSYKFRVRAVRSYLGTKYGKYSAVLTAKPLPAKVTGLAASAVKPTTATLKWTAVAGATGYTVQKYNGSKWVAFKTVKTNSLALTGLTPNTTTKFRVLAYRTVSKKNISGAESDAVSVVTTVAQVKGQKYTATNYTSGKLTWTAVANATGYKVEMYNASTKKWTVKYTAKTNSQAVTGLVPNTTSKFRIRAYVTASKKDYYGTYSAEISAANTIAKVTGQKFTATNAVSGKLTWTAVSNVSGYKVEQYNASTKKWEIKYTAKTNSQAVTGLTPNTTSKFRIRAYVTVSSTDYYGAYSAEVSAKTTLGTVGTVKFAQSTPVAGTLSWAAATNAQGYKVEQYNSTSKKWEVKHNTTSTSQAITGLVPGTTYQYRVRAYYGSAYTAYSATVNAKTTFDAPTDLAVASTGTNSAKLTWKDSASIGVTQYDIYAGTTKLGTVKNGVQSYTISDVKALKAFDFTVMAVSGSYTRNTNSVYLLNIPKIESYFEEITQTSYQTEYYRWSMLNPYGENVPADFKVVDLSTGETTITYASTKSTVMNIDKEASEKLTATLGSDGFTTISWPAVSGSDGYKVQIVSVENAQYYAAWQTVFDSHTSGDKTATSFKTLLADNFEYSIRVIAYNRKVEVAAVTIDDNNITAQLSNKVSCYMPMTVLFKESYKPVSSYNNSTNLGKTKIVLAAIQALNNTKSEYGTVKANIVCDIDAKMDGTKAVVDELLAGLVVKENEEKNVDWLIKALSSNEDGADLAKELGSAMGESATYAGTFSNNYGTFTITEGTKTGTASASLNKIIAPKGEFAYLYKADEVDKIDSKITGISASTSGGKTTIKFTIKQETANAKSPSTPVHNGIVEGFGEAVSAMDEAGSGSEITAGATPVTVVINSNGTLDSFDAKSPFSFKTSMSLGNDAIELKVLGTGFRLKGLKMDLSGTATYNYTFTR